MPENVGGLNPAAVAFVLLMAVLMLALPRKYALLPLFAAACYMTMAQAVSVGGLNFTIIRILTLVGWIRIIARGEIRFIRLNVIDKSMLMFTISSITIYTILWGTGAAFIYRCGQAYDAIGLFILGRALVRDVPEVMRVFKAVCVLVAPLAALMVVEKFTGKNLFAVFGGVPADTIVREGVLRCQGPFPHSILSGTFAAALVPFYLAMWYQKQGKALAVLGMLSSMTIVATSGSSGPFLTLGCSVLGFFLWPWRFRMQNVRRGIVAGIVLLQLVMKEPFWFIIAHMGVFSASTSFYRAFLIDQTIRHFSEWWLIGTKYLQPWAPLLTDITDMYVRVAFDGGLITLILFLVVIWRCFSGIGRALRAKVNRELTSQRIVWALGAALFAHCMTFLAVWYWDQNIVNWYLLLAMISTVSVPKAVRAVAGPPDGEKETKQVPATAAENEPAFTSLGSALN